MSVTHDEVYERQNSHSIPGLIRELRDESIVLVGQELELVKAEIAEKAARVTRNSAYLGVGSAVVFAGFLFILGALSAALAIVLAAADLGEWAAPVAALIVGVATAAIGSLVAYKGKHAVSREPPVLERTVESLKEDKRWAEQKLKGGQS